MSLYQSIYANVKKAHPNWENKRVYATVGSIMRNKNKKKKKTAPSGELQ